MEMLGKFSSTYDDYTIVLPLGNWDHATAFQLNYRISSHTHIHTSPTNVPGQHNNNNNNIIPSYRNIGIRLPNALELYNLNANVFLVEYRGFGDSSPGVHPSEAGIKSDSIKALEFIVNHPNINPQRLFIFGRSLGGAVGFHVAQHAQENDIPLAGLIVENTFGSIDKMVDALLPFLSPVKSLLLKIHYDSSKIAPQLNVPILYLAGNEDEIVPHSQMVELYQSSLQSSKHAIMHVVNGGMHNDTWLRGGKAYWNAIRDFLNP